MNLVVDTNIVFAALIRDSTIRKIILSNALELISINFGKEEIRKYRDEILTRTQISEHELDILLEELFKRLLFISDFEISKHMEEAKEIMDNIDPKDTPFIAAALVRKCSIWSDDSHFEKQDKIKVLKTEDVMRIINKE